MSIVEGYQKKIQELKNEKEELGKLSFSNSDILYLQMQLDGQILDYETRIRKITGYNGIILCSLCQQWFDAEMDSKIITVYNKRYCPTCLNTISQVMTIQEAEKKWGLKSGRIRQDYHRGKLQTYEEAGLFRRSENYWLVHSSVAEFYQK